MFKINLQLSQTPDESTRHLLPPHSDKTPFPSTYNGVNPSFGREMRALFNFGPDYVPLNHGSFGTYPRALLEYRMKLLRDWEERECIFTVYDYPRLLRDSRAAVAPLLGAAVDDVVLVPNATTGFNTILRNLAFAPGDVILYPETIYASCRNTVLSLQETTPVRGHEIPLTYPLSDDDLVALVRAALATLAASGHRVRAAIFDTIASCPGVRVPWERLVALCRAESPATLTIIDAAHGIGHLDLSHVGGAVQPDFLVTNCHKWLFAPRPAAVLYVPRRNQALLTTALPTSHGYLPPPARGAIPAQTYFESLFTQGATADGTPYLTVPAALRFRALLCGGEERVRDYCAALARAGGDYVAGRLGTEVMENDEGTLREGVAFANVRMPIHVAPRGFGRGMIPLVHGDGETTRGVVVEEEVEAVLEWWRRVAADEYGTFFQTYFYGGRVWVRLSAQVYLERGDFVWAAEVLKEMCERVKDGEWRRGYEEGVGGY
ncbi:pyridoxal phosphate-dependent transferase [Podospora conica]|nr:pyridoxal phosphate-dependent transferase [Schizothecium conicum]